MMPPGARHVLALFVFAGSLKMHIVRECSFFKSFSHPPTLVYVAPAAGGLTSLNSRGSVEAFSAPPRWTTTKRMVRRRNPQLLSVIATRGPTAFRAEPEYEVRSFYPKFGEGLLHPSILHKFRSSEHLRKREAAGSFLLQHLCGFIILAQLSLHLHLHVNLFRLLLSPRFICMST